MSQKRWAKEWDACQNCGTTETRHNAQGLCQKCYDNGRRLRLQLSSPDYVAQNLERRKRWAKENRGKFNAYQREYCKRRYAEKSKDPEFKKRLAEKSARYRRQNLEKHRERDRRNYAKRKANKKVAE